MISAYEKPLRHSAFPIPSEKKLNVRHIVGNMEGAGTRPVYFGFHVKRGGAGENRIKEVKVENWAT